jgi:hypothetical protein
MQKEYAKASGILWALLWRKHGHQHIPRNMPLEPPCADLIRRLNSLSKRYESPVRPVMNFQFIDSFVIFVSRGRAYLTPPPRECPTAKKQFFSNTAKLRFKDHSKYCRNERGGYTDPELNHALSLE